MERLLFEAVKLNRVNAIGTLLTHGVNVNAKNHDGNTPLHMAVLDENQDIVKLLIDSGADVNLKNRYFDTALILAVCVDNSAVSNGITKMLINADADVNYTNGKGESALMGAVALLNLETIKLLISRGADLQIAPLGNTVLHLAAAAVQSQDPAIFETLLAAGADPNAANSTSCTPLHVVCSKNYSPCKIVEVLHKYGADEYAVDSSGRTPMDAAIDNFNPEAVRALISYGGVSAKCEYTSSIYKTTILHKACEKFELELVRFLLKNGADVNAVDWNGQPALHYVVGFVATGFYSNFVEDEEVEDVVNCLLEWNSDVNLISKDGVNLLQFYLENNALPGFLSGAILKHLALLDAIKRPVDKRLLAAIEEKVMYSEFFDECRKELELLKNSKLGEDSWVTYFHVLVQGQRKLIRYAENTSSIGDIVKIFPNYGTFIDKKLSKAREDRTIWKLAAAALSDLLPVPIDPSHPVIDYIFDYCSMKDLMKLCL